MTYVRQIKRLPHIRRTEHLNNINSNPKYHNVIRKHLSEYSKYKNCVHGILWYGIKLLHHENNYYKTSFAEKVYT